MKLNKTLLGTLTALALIATPAAAPKVFAGDPIAQAARATQRCIVSLGQEADKGCVEILREAKRGARAYAGELRKGEQERAKAAKAMAKGDLNGALKHEAKAAEHDFAADELAEEGEDIIIALRAEYLARFQAIVDAGPVWTDNSILEAWTLAVLQLDECTYQGINSLYGYDGSEG